MSDRVLKFLHEILSYGFAVSLMGLVLTGCYTAPSSLSKPAIEQVVKLNNGYKYSYITLFGSACTYSLRPGEYRAELKGNGGTYFRGADHPVQFVGVDGKRKLEQEYQGGFFLPDDPSASAKVFMFIGSHTPPRVTDSETGEPKPIDYMPDGTSSGKYEQKSVRSTADVATDLVVPPAAPPGEGFVKGVGAGIGAGVVTAMVNAEIGRIKFTDSQPNDSSLRNSIMF